MNPGVRVPQLGVAYQPAFFYEQRWDVLVFAILWQLRKRITSDGQLFALYLGLYAVGKFAITFVRLDPVYIWGLQQSHFVALGLLMLAIGWSLWNRCQTGMVHGGDPFSMRYFADRPQTSHRLKFRISKRFMLSACPK